MTGSDSQPRQTFLFTDLAGFTALTEAHGDEHAADLVESFCVAVRGLLAGLDAEVVKTIGDALLIRLPDGADAVRLALRIVGEVGGRHGFPAVRVGVHTGTAVRRGDDWFGAAVNLAARISQAAAAGEVLVTETTRAAGAHELGDVRFGPRQRARFKNIRDPVEFSSAVPDANPAGSGQLEIDPICRMAVAPERAAASRAHEGRVLYFCSLACAEAFRGRDPAHEPMGQ